MNIKVEAMSLNQFKGVLTNADILMDKLVHETKGHIKLETLVGSIRKYLSDNGIHTTEEEVKEYVASHAMDKMLESLGSDELESLIHHIVGGIF